MNRRNFISVLAIAALLKGRVLEPTYTELVTSLDAALFWPSGFDNVIPSRADTYMFKVVPTSDDQFDVIPIQPDEFYK